MTAGSRMQAYFKLCLSIRSWLIWSVLFVCSVTSAEASSTVYVVDIQGPNINTINVAGTANLSGSLTLNVLQPPNIKTNYTILQATNGVVGVFSSNNLQFSPLGFLEGTLTYNPNNVIIYFNLNAGKMLIEAITSNQRAIANYLLNVNQVSNLPQSIVNMLAVTNTPQQYQINLDQMSGATYANQLLTLSRLAYASGFESEVGDRLSIFPYCDNSYHSTQSNHYEDCNSERILWATVDGGSQSLSQNTSSGSNSNDIGMTVGSEFPLKKNITIGVALGFNHFNSSATSPEIAHAGGDLFQLGVYGRYEMGPLLWGLDANFGTTNNVNMNRTITASGATISGQYHTDLFSEQLRLTYNVYKNIVRPFIGIYNQNILGSSFTESGTTGYELMVNANAFHSFRSLVGVLFDVPTHSIINPFFSVSYEHEFAQTYGTFNAQLVAVSSSDYFHIAGTPIGRDLADIKSGIKIVNSQHWSLNALYEGQFAHSWVDNSGRVQFVYNFA